MKRVAVIGAGISGLAAASFLSRRHRVDLFEQERRLGGHTNTVLVNTNARMRTLLSSHVEARSHLRVSLCTRLGRRPGRNARQALAQLLDRD